MDLNTFRERILSDPFADNAQVLDAARKDREKREMLEAVRSVEANIEDLLTSAPVPPFLYEKLLSLPDGDENGEGSFDSPVTDNAATIAARIGTTIWRFRLAIIFTLIIVTAASLSIFMPGPNR